MKQQAVFFHAGCPVCVAAEQSLVAALDRARFDVEVVHLGSDKARLPEARRLGVQSVPALVLGGQVHHVNFGAKIADLG
jgi:glutaredoxin